MIRLFFSIAFVFCSFAQAALQTDTHTYIVGTKSDQILAIDRSTDEKQIIQVGEMPIQMVTHGNFGYVVNQNTNDVSVIDLQTNTVIQTIPVGEHPKQMVIHGNMGYVVNWNTCNVSALDLQTNTVTQTLYAGERSLHISLHGNVGYKVNFSSNSISVLNLLTHTVIQNIRVGVTPKNMVIHRNVGYVVNIADDTLSVIDLQTNTVTQTIRVGRWPQFMVIDKNLGYVINHNSGDVSVIDLQTNTVIQTIPVGKLPLRMVIHGDFGYVQNTGSRTISVLDLQTNTLIGTLQNPENSAIDFSDTHAYLGVRKIGPLYPTIVSMQLMKEECRLGEFMNMDRKVFKLDEVKPRDYPVDENKFDLLPPYILAQEIFWDGSSDKPFIDPVNILATLTTMKYPQRFLQHESSMWLRPQLHMAFFQAVWLGQTEKAQAMLRYFIQLGDPVITKYATYKTVKPEATPSGATNSTSK